MCTSERFENHCGIDYVTPIDSIIETINQAYSDPRVRDWEITGIMPMVRGRLIEGWTLNDLDEVISYRIRMKEIDKKLESPNLSGEDKRKLFNQKNELVLNRPKVLKWPIYLGE
jgi:hypothetical protein